MKLTLEQIRSITKGAQNVRLEDGKYHFYRFSDKQMEYYKENSADFYKKAFATASVHLDFYTDSAFFKFHYDVTNGSSRKFYYFDMYVDGVLVKHLGEDNMWINKEKACAGCLYLNEVSCRHFNKDLDRSYLCGYFDNQEQKKLKGYWET